MEPEPVGVKNVNLARQFATEPAEIETEIRDCIWSEPRSHHANGRIQLSYRWGKVAPAGQKGHLVSSPAQRTTEARHA
jgi:hypothetical protein